MMSEDYPKIYLYKRLVQAKLFIDSHYSEKIDLTDIADEAYFSKFHFIRAFKNIYRKTPHQYLIYVRIEKAKVLLKSRITITDVCYAVGFESLSSFCGLFKRMVSATPATYSLQHQKIKTEIVRSPLGFIPGCFADKNGWTEKIAISENQNRDL
jgi:AraC-like DNA-binding protein